VLQTELTCRSAADMAEMVRQKKVSPLELVDAHLARIEGLNPTLNAFVCADPDGARAQARAAEAKLMAEGDLPPLLGLPVSIKSCIDVAGLRSEAGSALRAGYVAETDAPLVRRLKGAGAIILGTTNTPEMLMAYDTDNLLYGATRNPWDPERTPGGSSGGEAAAIASGCSAAGIGSDGGGSIRVPAHFCGICGLKPTPGRIPGTGHYPPCVGPFAQLGVVGPMARTVRDLEMLFGVLAGPDIGDPSSVPVPFRTIKAADVRGLRVGMFVDGAASVDTVACIHRAAAALLEEGLLVEPFVPQGLDEAHLLWVNIFCRAGAIAVRAAVGEREADLSPTLRDFLDFVERSFSPLSADELLNTLVRRDIVRARFLEHMQRHPILLMPVSSAPAFRRGDGGWGPAHPANYIETMRCSQYFNLLGNPALVVPVGQSAEGLPIGVQLVARPYEEAQLLAVGRALEQHFGWTEPPLSHAAAGQVDS
jgi:Asp-tRNA(Asn)/Glu-tRNA(Gln) amidotransferase A subunit family amidase